MGHVVLTTASCFSLTLGAMSSDASSTSILSTESVAKAIIILLYDSEITQLWEKEAAEKKKKWAGWDSNHAHLF